MSRWKVWDDKQTYGDLFFKRAMGELPEMESSKALAKIIQPYLNEGDKIGDIGCGGGHYLRSMDNKSTKKFHYVGIDQTSYYIQKAKEAFSRPETKNELRLTTSFNQGDIFSIQNIGVRRTLSNSHGAEPKYFDKLIGQIAKKDLFRNDPINMEDIF